MVSEVIREDFWVYLWESMVFLVIVFNIKFWIVEMFNCYILVIVFKDENG